MLRANSRELESLNKRHLSYQDSDEGNQLLQLLLLQWRRRRRGGGSLSPQ